MTIQEALTAKKSVLITDFDRTLTVAGSSMHTAVKVLGADSSFAAARDSLYRTYGWVLTGQGEAGQRRQAAEMWWEEQMELCLRENIPADVWQKTARLLAARREGKAILQFCIQKEIPVFIVSSGMGNVIDAWLAEQGLAADCLTVFANRIFYESGYTTGYAPVVTIENKAERFWQCVTINHDRRIVQLGDRPDDLAWGAKDTVNYLVDPDGTIRMVSLAPGLLHLNGPNV